MKKILAVFAMGLTKAKKQAQFRLQSLPFQMQSYKFKRKL